MEILYIILPISLSLSMAFVGAYIWAVKRGQFQDMTTPAVRILFDDEDDSLECKSFDR